MDTKMTEDKSADDPKIIVDEDWKSQVENEKEQIRQQESGEADPATNEPDHPPIPPASFALLTLDAVV